MTDLTSPPDTSILLEGLLRDAGRLAVQMRSDAKASRKSDGSPVTAADQAIDRMLAEGLTAAFPGVGVVGEEGARLPDQGAGVFYVDPIDGTRSYARGLSDWGPTVGLLVDGRLEMGALYLPVSDTFFFAQRDRGAFRDGVRLGLPELPPISERILFAPSRFHRHPNAKDWRGRIRVLGSTAAHLAHVAAGDGALVVVPTWSLWDVACGALLVTESGGVLSTLRGRRLDSLDASGEPAFLAGHPDAIDAFDFARLRNEHGY